MKKLIFSLFALFLLSATPVLANGEAPDTEPLIVRSEVMEGGLHVVLANLQQEKTFLTLTNLDRKREVFADVIRKHNGYSYKLDLEKMKDGRYLLTVKKGETTRRQVILIKGGDMTCSDWK